MKNIFFCITPLEIIIAKNIIEKKKINKKDCELFFFNSVNNDKIKYYYNNLKAECSKSNFYLLDKRFPNYFFDIKNIFKKKKYNNIYVAALDSIIIHIALSFIEYDNLYTFDDGLGNILKQGIYFNKRKHPFYKKYIYFLFGNRFSTEKVITNSKKHFTIFNNFKNVVSSNTEYIEIFTNKKNISNGKSCSVILGTVFKEYYVKDYKLYTKKCQKFINSIKSDVYYINHPRDNNYKFNNIISINSDKIAEEIIFDLMKKYEFINLYGFMSTTQFNFIEHKNIIHHFIINNEKRVEEGIKLLDNKKIHIHKI